MLNVVKKNFNCTYCSNLTLTHIIDYSAIQSVYKLHNNAEKLQVVNVIT